jgi:hypothetical protein
MSVLRLSGFVLILLLLASLSALASPPSMGVKSLITKESPVVTGQGTMLGGIVKNDVANSDPVVRDLIEFTGPSTEIIPSTGVNVPELGQ